MKKIPLSQGKYALVDDEDFEYLNQWRWHFSSGYAVSTVIKRGSTYMHSLVNKTPKGKSTDHINEDKLDNRRSNLRTCTQSQNMVNTGLRTDNMSGYKGIRWDPNRGKWHVQSMRKNLGRFTDLSEAISVYNAWLIEHFGEYAKLNEV